MLGSEYYKRNISAVEPVVYIMDINRTNLSYIPYDLFIILSSWLSDSFHLTRTAACHAWFVLADPGAPATQDNKKMTRRFKIKIKLFK